MKKRFVDIILIVIMLVGLGVIGYPTFSDWWNSFHQTRAIASYVEQVAAMDKDEMDAMWAEAEKYNAKLHNKVNRFILSDDEKEEYNRVLDITGTGIMGYIDIDAIDISFPIYHGTEEAVLQIAIGHIEGTSLPIGGLGAHVAVSGHRGLPSAKLFTDIDKLVEGDRFIIQVLDRTMTYEVDQIRIVLPEDLSNLVIDEKEDYVTLITCTPYGINTHRLLVRGHRVENEAEADVTANAMRFKPYIVAPLVAAPILLILLIMLIISTGRRRRK